MAPLFPYIPPIPLLISFECRRDLPFDGGDVETAQVGFFGRLDKDASHQTHHIVRVDFDI